MARFRFGFLICLLLIFSSLAELTNADTPVALVPFSEDFEAGILAPYWTISGTSGHRTQVTEQYGPHAGTYHLAMDRSSSGAYSRNEVTLVVDLEGYTNVVLSFWARDYGDEPHGPPPSPFVDGADFDGVAISSDGTNWYEVAELRSLSSTYTRRTVDLDAAVSSVGLTYSSTFKIRFNQYDNYALSTDGIGIDDITITGVSFFGDLAISVPSNVSESDGMLVGAGMVSVNTAPVSNLLVNLASTDFSEVFITNSVIIPAGQTNAVFDIWIQDDAVLDGSQSAMIIASAKDYRHGEATLRVYDSETAVLTLSLTDTTEGAGWLEGALQVDTPPDSDIQVQMHSSDTNEILSRIVVVPAGQTLVPVELAVIDDAVVDGVKTVVIEASVDNWTGDACNIFVFDNEQVVPPPSSVPEEPGEGAMPWPMYQGNKEHTGYVPVFLDPAKSKKLWSKQVGSSRALNPVTVAAGKVYVSKHIYFNYEDQLFVLDAQTGAKKWAKNFGSIYSVNPPSYAYGNVYLQTCDHTPGTYLRAFNAETGAIVFQSPYNEQWGRYLAPTIEGGVVYINGGYYGGMYAFDAYSGAQRWFAGSLPGYDGWTPTIGPDYVYSYQGEYSPGLYALDKVTGVLAYRIGDPNFDWTGWSMNTVAIYGENGLMYAVHDGRLITFNTQTQKLLWENSDAFKGQPSYRDDVVYALNGKGVSAVSASSNQILWSWIPSGDTLSRNIIVTDSHLILGSASKTYMVDLKTHQQVWSYPKGGHLSLAEGILYIASSNGDLTALSVLPRLAIELITEAAEGDGAIHMAGEVKMGEALPYDLVVNLFSSDPLQANAIGPITIPAGQTNAAFDLEIMDDALLDGSQLVTIGAQSDGYADATGSLWVHDNESATLSLTLPQSTVEGSGGISGTVNVTPTADRDVVVNLVSDNPEKISGGRVVIKAGDASADFTLSVLDDDLIDHLQTATIEARVDNWESARVSIFIADNETTDIRLVFPSNTMEGDGLVANAGEIVLSGTPLSDVHIMLKSLDVSEVTVPFFVTIPAGQLNAFFDVTSVDDDFVDGKQYPIITASAPGFIPTSQSISISDNEFHHFTIVGFSGEDPGYVPVPCSVHAVNMDDEYVKTYSGPAWLSGVLGSDPVAVDPAEAITLTNGLWQGMVTFHGVGDNARIFTDDGNGHVGTNEVSLSGLNIVKMATDWELPYIYMVHRYKSSPNRSILIWYNTDSMSIEHAISAGENATDLTVSYGDNCIYVNNAGRGVVRTFDRTLKSELPSLAIGSYARVNAGRTGLIFVENGSSLRAYDTTDGTQVASTGLGYNTGDGDCTLDGTRYYHCDNGTSGSRLYQIDVSADTYVTKTSIRTANYYGSDRVFVSMDGKRVYNCKHVYDADLNVLLNIGSEIYAASAYGDLVLTSTKAYNGVSGEEVYMLPFSSSVMAFSSDQSSLVLFNSSDGTITNLNTSNMMPLPEPVMVPDPADGSAVGTNLEELSWPGAPFAIAHDVYLGTDSNAVALATTNSVQYLGRQTATDYQLSEGVLMPGQTYYWRVDVVGFAKAVVTGRVWRFETAFVAVEPYELNVTGVAAAYTQMVSIAVNSASTSPVAWTASCTSDWMLLGTASGATPETLDIGFDMSVLDAGIYAEEIMLSTGGVDLAVKVSLEVFPLNITKMEADNNAPRLYALNVVQSGLNLSQLVVINTGTKQIEQVIPVVRNASDFAVHYGDNRIYVSAFGNAAVSVVDRATFQRLEDLTLDTQVYRISSGIAGRLVTEDDGSGNAYYGRMRVWDSLTGTLKQTTSSYSTGRGTGESTVSGLNYYRGDSTRYPYTGYLRKYDLSGGTLVQVKNVGASKSSRRELVLSSDGSRVFWTGKVYDSDLNLVTDLGAEVYASSSNGSMAATTDKVLGVDLTSEVATLPSASTAMAFVENDSRLVYFSGTSKAFEWLELSSFGPIISITPADLTNIQVVAGESLTRTLIISNAGNATLEFEISGGGNTNTFSLDDGLIAYYPFNGNADDESGNGHDGTVNGAILTIDRFEKADSAYCFDGMNDFINCGISDAFEMGASGSLSVWIRPKINTDASVVISKDGTGYNNDFAMGFYPHGLAYGPFAFTFNRTIEHDIPFLSTNVETGRWTHIVSEWDSDGMKLFVDGALVAENDTVCILGAGGIPLYIGQMQGIRFFNGDIDDVRVYDRVLSPSEVLELYREGDEGDDGLIAYYPFNGNADDESGHGHDGVVLGGVAYQTNGVVGRAVVFDGSTAKIQIPHADDLNLGGPFSITCWMKSSGSNPNGALLAKIQSFTPRNGYLLAVNPDLNPDSIRMIINKDWPTVHGIASSTKNVLDANWHHVTATYDEEILTLYIDGRIEMQTAYTNGLTPNTLPLYLGWDPYGSDRYFNGQLDEVRIYNRALSEPEINELYREVHDNNSTTETVLFEDGFEDGNFDGWIQLGGMPTIASNVVAKGLYSFSVSGGGAHNAGVYRNLPDITPDRIDFYIRGGDKLYSSEGYFKMGEGVEFSGQVLVFYMSGGEMHVNGHHEPFEAERWYKITFLLDWNGRQFDFIKDDLLVASNLNFTSIGTAINRIDLYNYSSDGVAWWDDIRFTESETSTGSQAGWVSADPVSGTVAPGSSVTVSVEFDAAGMKAGDYTNTALMITCNDVLSPTTEVPVSMNAIGDVTSQDITITFGQFATGRTSSYSEKGYDFGTSGYMYHTSGDYNFFPKNGTVYINVPLSEGLTVSRSNGALFSAKRIDLSEYSTAVAYHMTNIVIRGYKKDGSLVEARFATDGVMDGFGGLDDFETFNFPNYFVDLVRLDFPTMFAMDNLVLSETYSLPLSDYMVWQNQYFPLQIQNTRFDEDYDGDGLNNRDEYIAGMDPTNPESSFMVNSVETDVDGAFVVTWDSVTGRVYSIWWKNGLGKSFQPLETGICYPQNSYTDTVHSVEGCGFYKVDVELK